MRAYLGLGSNLGDREAHLRSAVKGLRDRGCTLEASPVYETAPVGGPPGQGKYLNCVVRLETELSPRELLALAQELEREAGRVRTVKDGPRTLDVDLLLFDDLVIAEADLSVPHPRLYERAFVLAPLEDLDPSLVPRNWRHELEGSTDLVDDLHKLGRIDLG